MGFKSSINNKFNDTKIQILQTKINGCPTISIETPKGKITLHSKFNPLQEAKNFINTFDISNVSSIIVFGFGLGYHCEEIIDNYPNLEKILVVEPNIQVFSYALHLRDLTKLMINGKMYFLIGSFSEVILKLNEFIQYFLNVSNDTQKCKIIIHSPSFQLIPPEEKDFIEILAYMRRLYSKSKVFPEEQQTNIEINIGDIEKVKGVSQLFETYKNIPVFIIGAGPSLDKNIYHLKFVQLTPHSPIGQARCPVPTRHTPHATRHNFSIPNSRAPIIICVDAAIKALKRLKIIPNFIFSIDPQNKTTRFFNDYEFEGENLVYFLFSNPHIVQRFPLVNKYIATSTFNETEKEIEEKYKKGKLYVSGNVFTPAFDLAIRMGGNPIVFVGSDFAVLPQQTHTLYSPANESRVLLEEMKSTGGFWGEKVKTTERLYLYLRSVESYIEHIQEPKPTIINATEGGAEIQGTIKMDLKEVIFRYC